MNYETLAKKAGYFKKDEKGVAAMCRMLEGMNNIRSAVEEVVYAELIYL